MDVQLRLQHDLLAVETEHDVHGMVDIAVPDEPTDASRPLLRLALVLDRSGSMAGARRHQAVRALPHRTSVVRGRARVGDLRRRGRGPRPARSVNEGALGQAIDAIGPGGMTNLSSGWLKGVGQLRCRDDGTRRVLLLTDGLANRGVTEPDRLRGMAEEVAGQGITTTTLGFGDGFSEELLTAIADAGRGDGPLSTLTFCATNDTSPSNSSAKAAGHLSGDGQPRGCRRGCRGGGGAEVTEEVTVLMAARATDEARRLADEGRFDEAGTRLREVVGQLRDLAPHSERAGDLRRKADSRKWSAREMSDDAYPPAASKRMHYRSHEMKRRRPTRPDEPEHHDE